MFLLQPLLDGWRQDPHRTADGTANTRGQDIFRRKTLTASMAYNFFLFLFFKNFPYRLEVSDIDISLRELTRKVIRRGIPPHAPPSCLRAGSDERHLCLLPDLISVTRTIPNASPSSCYNWNSKDCPRHHGTFLELLSPNGLALLSTGGNLIGDQTFTRVRDHWKLLQRPSA